MRGIWQPRRVTDLYRSADGERRVRDWCTRRLDAWPVPHGRATVETSLGGTHLVEAGEGDPVCVYLPGTSFNTATSLAVLEALSVRGRVVAVDLPGQPGLSSASRPRPETPGYARWLSELLDAVRSRHPGRPVVLAGHSRGAAVALSGPTDVERLVLLSPAGLVGVRTSMAVLRTAVPWMLRPTRSRSESLLRLMGGPGSEPDRTLTEWLTLVARETRSTGAPGPLPEVLLARWRGADVRVAVGSDDCFFPAERVAAAARTRLGATVTLLPSTGHLAVDERPGQVAELVTGGPAVR